MRTMVLCAVIITSIAAGVACGEDNDRDQLRIQIDQVMSAARRREPTPFRRDLIAKEHGLSVLPCLKPYFRDDSRRVRWQAYGLVWFVGRLSADNDTRRQVVDLLARGLMDEQVDLDSTLLERLCSFQAEDFSDDAKGILTKVLAEATAEPPTAPVREAFLAIGVANMREALPAIGKCSYDGTQSVSDIVKKNRWFDSSHWSALKARARMGVKEDIQLCIELVEAHPDHDQRARELFKHLAYVRQPEVLEYIRPFLFSDHLEDVGGSIDLVPVSEGEWAAAALGQMLEGFPWTMDSPASRSALEECRAWMKGRTEYPLIR